MVDRIVDIAAADEELDTSQRQAAIRGRAVIAGRMVDIVDMRELAQAHGISLPAVPVIRRPGDETRPTVQHVLRGPMHFGVAGESRPGGAADRCRRPPCR